MKKNKRFVCKPIIDRKDYFHLTVEGFNFTLEKSELRELIGTIDNKIL